jgi:replicative DNA helicase
MVNQLTLAFERSNIILSPFDDVLHKQLVNYEVEKINANGKPVYTSIDEHFIDALGLAYLAFVLEFKELTNVMKDPETSSKIVHTNKSIVKSGMNKMMQSIQSSYNNSSRVQLKPSDDRPGDKQKWVKVTQSYNPYRSSNSWGSRAGRGGGRLGRSMW